ncbi:MAG: hypothetical protein R2741_08300 [Methanolobus sp.]
MSLEMYLYLEDANDSFIPLWIEKLNQLNMECEIHPDFSFDNASGFLPFKIKLNDSQHHNLLNQEFRTGFELDVDDFNLDNELEAIKPKQNFLEKILNRKSSSVYFANQEIDEKLKRCKKVLYFRWGSSDTFELRMALLGSATLSVLTNGVCYDPQGDIWHSNSRIIEESLNDVQEYESALQPDKLILHKFEEWL